MKSRWRIARRWTAGQGEQVPPRLLGAKGAHLQALSDRGIPVPRWFALTTAAADAVLAPLREPIDEVARAVPSGDSAAAREASDRIARLVREAPWPRLLRDEIAERLLRLRTDGELAVRSSSGQEDGAESSHAGQLTTTLHVASHEVERAVVECWAGAWSERAILYRQARELPPNDILVAVIVQEMVAAIASGVAFTADPLTGAPAHVVVAGFGLGDGVVTDQVECDEYVRRPSAPGWKRIVRHKTRRSSRREDGTPGTEIVSVPPAWRDRPVLTEGQLDRLASWLARIESAAGRPQDVEWALDESGLLFILQARPITAIPEGTLAIWDDGNIGESYPGVTLPLTYSYVRAVYGRVFGRALREIGASRETLEAAAEPLSQLVGTLQGRLYLNVQHFYRLFRLVPGLEPAARRWEVAFGIHPEFGAGGALRFGSIRTGLKLAGRFLRLRADAERLQQRAVEMIHRHRAAPCAGKSFEELLALYGAIERDYLDDWALVIFNDLYATYFTDRLARLCGGLPSGAAAGAPAGDLHHRLLCGEERMQSVGPIRSVVALAGEARATPGVARIVRSALTAQDAWRAILESPEAASFRAKAIEHVREHGDRTMDELKLEARTLRDEPWTLVAILRNYLDLGLSAAEMESREREIRTAAEREFQSRFRGRPLQRQFARWILNQARRTVTDRENMALSRCRAHELLRRLFRSMGEDLARRGALDGADDIFYITIEELRAYASGSLPDGELTGLCTLRRGRYAAYAGETEPPHRVLCRGSVYRPGVLESTRRRNGDARCSVAAACTAGGNGSIEEEVPLRGTPCSPGRVRGIARVLRAASPADRVEGEILVAPVTDPGWMYLMLAAKGLIVERGSILSHTAIIGRELGIPTIVGVEDAVERIETGDEIEMDGGTGEIRIRRRRADPAERPPAAPRSSRMEALASSRRV